MFGWKKFSKREPDVPFFAFRSFPGSGFTRQYFRKEGSALPPEAGHVWLFAVIFRLKIKPFMASFIQGENSETGLKNESMKTKILVFVMFVSLSIGLVAQPADKDQRKSFRGSNRTLQANNDSKGIANGLNLTAEQREAFRQSMLVMQKQLQPIRNELGEAEARQKTLTTAEKPDLASVNKNIEKIGALKVEMAKIKARHRMEIRAQLTEEQRLRFDMHNGRMDRWSRPGAMPHTTKMKREHLVD